MKNSILLNSVMLLIGSSLLVFSCKSDKIPSDTTRRPVDPQLTQAIPFRDFEVNTENADTIRLPEGTAIYIAPGTFVNEKGNAITGKVLLHYRAFYSAGDIIASGITMHYDSAGTSHLFSSAGMFELTGTQNGNPVSIAEGKAIALDFASTKNDATYSFYRLDTVRGNWDFLAATKAESNKLHDQFEQEIAALNLEQPIEPKSFNTKKPVIDIDVDVDNHPELSFYNGIVWQYAGEGNDPEKNQWIYSTSWNTATIERTANSGETYLLKLSGKEKSFTTHVMPSFKSADLAKAMVQFNIRMEKFRSAQKAQQEKEKQVEIVHNFQRPVAISRLGIHNCDMFTAAGLLVKMNAEFHFADPDFEKNRQSVTVYVISARGKISVGYNALTVQNMLFLGNDDNCMIAVLKGTKKACVLNNADFASALRQNGKSGYGSFNLQPSSQEVANANDVNTLLRTL